MAKECLCGLESGGVSRRVPPQLPTEEGGTVDHTRGPHVTVCLGQAHFAALVLAILFIGCLCTLRSSQV